MSLEVSLRLVNTETGEYRELEDGDFHGSGYLFVKHMIERKNAYGKYIVITDEVFEELCDGAMAKLKSDGFCDLDTNYGIMGFVKLLHLREFYAKLGYTLCVEADW